MDPSKIAFERLETTDTPEGAKSLLMFLLKSEKGPRWRELGYMGSLRCPHWHCEVAQAMKRHPNWQIITTSQLYMSWVVYIHDRLV